MLARLEQTTGQVSAPLEAAIRRYFAKRLPAHEVDDFVQEVLIRIEQRQAANPIDDMQRYVFVVAGNLLRRHLGQTVNVSDEAMPELASPITPERELIARDQMRRVSYAIDRLPSRTRDVFVLHRFEDMTYSGIAAGLGISVSAVEKHIIAALRALRAALSDGDEE